FETDDSISPELISLSRSSTHDTECGFVVVPENREVPDGPTVRLPVAIARTRSPNPEPDPVIYLAGGGGHAHLTYAHLLLASVGDAVLEKRDFIQYNQRGAPGTEPVLECAGYTEFLFSLAARPEVGSLWSVEHDDYLDDCRQTLAGRGIDLTQYNSATNAIDARDVRIALGYEEANYYGTSYGTRLGLALLRDHPEGVRSIILDSVYPPEAGYYSEFARSLDRAFGEVFDACTADDECAAAYPDLESDFLATVDRLNDEPQMVNSPFGPVSVDGGIFMDAMAIYLYPPELIPRSPAAMATVAAGDLQPVEMVVAGAVTSPEISWNMFYAMQCREEVPFESYEEAMDVAAGLPSQIISHYLEAFARLHVDMCARSLSGAADPVEARAVTSEIPALVLAGRFDPATPPTWSQATAASLGNATYLEFPTLGHGIMRSSPCGLEIGLAFIDDPSTTPDTACIEELEPISFETN
ncbi:MAG: alpha/beta hydrolase, partial [Actinomycetia bacterium]|nr:alpha/beta hydrolase [Actinomycetes bacterium]